VISSVITIGNIQGKKMLKATGGAARGEAVCLNNR